VRREGVSEEGGRLGWTGLCGKLFSDGKRWDGMGWDGTNHVSCEYVRRRALIDY